MDDFDKDMQLLLIAKVTALEQALESHLPEVFLLYRELLKTSVAKLLIENRIKNSDVIVRAKESLGLE